MDYGCRDCCETKDLTHASAAYRRALVIVVLLNLGMGGVEIGGGLLGLSQALKADALDFLGDGTITWLGLLAIARGPRWRARAALMQGAFLGLLAVGVLAAATYRALVQRTPEPGIMTSLGLLAFAVNVAAAAVLVRHRSGDANIRAVWLFSRNDAIGNLVVVLAGALVAWTTSPWPDLIAAAFIAALFLHSSLDIMQSARRELRHLATAAAPPSADVSK